MDSKNFKLVPKPRVGLKREFEFALKSHAETSGSNDLARCRQNQDAKKSKVASFNSKKFPSKLSDLMNSGILEGQKVKYAHGVKVQQEQGVTNLEGVISGNGIRCNCQICKGKEVCRPTSFELHAGSSNKHPSEHIFLDNGMSLRKLMNTFLTPRLHNLEEHVQKAIGDLTLEKSKFCLNCRDVNVISGLLCDSCVQEEKESQHTYETSNRSPEAVVTLKPLNNGMEQITSSDKSRGRQTRKDHSFHKSLFQNKTVLPERTELEYVVSGKKVLKGSKDGLGILCKCCNSNVSPSKFEAHAGYASRRKPYLHIYVSGGVSLHQLSINALKKQKISTTDKDDVCENNENVVAAERNAGIDSSEIVNQICTRETNQVENGDDVCALCSRTYFSTDFGPTAVIICDQCEREYHVGCWKEHNMQTLEELPEGDWFCCRECNDIHNHLQNLVARGEDHLPNSILSEIRKKNEENGSKPRWRVLNKKLIASDDHEARQLLSRVVDIFQDRFAPIIDPASGEDFIPAMLNGESINNQDFRGMYCAVLTVKQEIICAGIFRVFGQEVAELPLAATNKKWEKQGYFRCLLSLIEGQLTSCKVRQFVLPAADKVVSMWTSKFEFKKLKKDEMAKYRSDYNLMMFHKTTLLKKSVPSCLPDAKPAIV